MQAAQRKTDYNTVSHQARKRVVKMQGNVAYINNDFLGGGKPRQKAQPKTSGKTQAQAKKRPAVKAKAQTKPKTEQSKAHGRGIASTLFVVFVAFCALALLVSRHSEITSIGVQNNAIQSNIASIEAQIDELALDIELNSTVQAVQNAARELGMTYPVNNQKIHIDINS